MMIPGDALLDAFIDANILLCVAFLLWYCARLLLERLGVKNAYGTHLKVLNGVFLTVAVAPFVVLLFSALQTAGWMAQANLNLSDMVVAHYLNGGFEMKASEFEALVLMRDTFTLNVLSGVGFVAQAAILVFAIGFVLGAARLVHSVVCLRKIVSHSYPWRGFGRIRLRLSDRTLVPFSTRGWRNYYVVIPSYMIGSRDDLKVSIAHEFQHIRQGDLEWEIVLEALKPVFFLNPVFHAWKRQVEALRELNCDWEVLGRGRIGVRSYCNTLLSVCQSTLRRDRAFIIAVPKVTLVTADRSAISGGKQSFLERRVTSMLEAKRLSRPKLLQSIILLPLVFSIMLTAISIQSPGDWSHDRLMLSTVVNLERLDEINRLSAFGQVRD